MTSLSGVSWEEVWEHAVEDLIDDVPVRYIGKAEFLKNKRSLG